MVNTGKPSRGCHMCRARRIKCDEGKPNCMRCIKSKRVCPGYRDAFELKLRDQSKSTKKKQVQFPQQSNQHRALSGHASSSSSSSSSYPSNTQSFNYGAYPSTGYSRGQNQRSRWSPGSSISQSERTWYENAMIARYRDTADFIASQMTTPLHQQAACYFLANFVLVPEAGTMRGYLDFIIPLLKKPKPSNSLSFAFSAVAFAALGTRPGSKMLLADAGMWYLKALKEINAALKNASTASSDSTIAAVMLMAIFEQLTPSRMKVGGWSSHVDGAVAVIKSRTKDQWKDRVSRDLFIAVRAHMTIHCIANSRHPDPGVDWLGVKADDDIVQRFSAMNLKMASLRADNDTITPLKEHTSENTEKVLGLMKRAEDLDQEYLNWIATLPENWAITTVAWVDESDVTDFANSVVHPGRVDAFEQLWTAYKYNIVRACRLNIYVTILRCVAWLGGMQDFRNSPEFANAANISRQLVDEIVASVPYFFGWKREENLAMADHSNFACGTNEFVSPKPLVGIFSMWPLFTAASSDFATTSQSLFLKGRIKYIAQGLGVNQAWIMFQAQLRSPSMYIMRDRYKPPPTPYDGNITLEAKVDCLAAESPPRDDPDMPSTAVTPSPPASPARAPPPPPTSTKSALHPASIDIPRSFRETQLMDDEMARGLLSKAGQHVAAEPQTPVVWHVESTEGGKETGDG